MCVTMVMYYHVISQFIHSCSTKAIQTSLVQVNDTYCKRGKIRWAKLLWIPPKWSFSQKNFCGVLRLKHLNNTIMRCLYNVHGKTFAVLLKARKTWKFSLAQQIFHHLQYILSHCTWCNVVCLQYKVWQLFIMWSEHVGITLYRSVWLFYCIMWSSTSTVLTTLWRYSCSHDPWWHHHYIIYIPSGPTIPYSILMKYDGEKLSPGNHLLCVILE